VKGRRPNR